MNEQALFCDGLDGYVIPAEPKEFEKVILRFRTAKDDVDEVRLVTKGLEYLLLKDKTQGPFDYYSLEWQLDSDVFSYYFKIIAENEVCYYNRCGVYKPELEYYHFEIVPGFSTPEWAKGAVMYQIFVDRFYNGDRSNDVEDGEYFYIGGKSEKVELWEKTPENVGIREFYGGDLQGIIEKLDYIKGLGVQVIYLNPIFVSPSNHKYDVQDYDYVDPHYGKIVVDGGSLLEEEEYSNQKATKYQIRTTNKQNLEASNQLFVELVEQVHERGMKIILDGVFNHCGSFNKWMDRERIYENQEGYEKGAYVSKESPYHNFFRFHDEDQKKWPYNHTYDGWWGHDTLPKLNYEDSEELRNYILEVGKKWVSAPYNADGWRLDVAADLGYSNEFNHEFWNAFRAVVKEANPQALILAEHYGNPFDWLRGDEWDTIMNYDAFMEPITWFLTGMQKHSDEYRGDLYGNADNFRNSIVHHMSNMLPSSLLVSMNELSNHDHSRFLTRTNHMVGRVENLGSKAASEGVDKAVLREAVVFQMTWMGAPTIYYGDEAGLCGFTDPDNRRTYPWGQEDQELIAFHRDMIWIHRNYQGFMRGSIKMIYQAQDVIAFGRFQEGEQLVVALNNSDTLKEITLPVWEIGVPLVGKLERLIYSYKDGYTKEHEEYKVENGNVVLNMGPRSAIVLKSKTCSI